MNSVISFDMGTRNLAVCHVAAPHKILRWCLVDLRSNDIKKSTRCLVSAISAKGALGWVFECDSPIVIESQPRAGPVKTLSHVLHGIVMFRCPDRPVTFVAASSKFKAFAGENGTRNTYNERKQLAIDIAQKHIDSEFSLFFQRMPWKQQGDLADSFLQGVSVLAHMPRQRKNDYDEAAVHEIIYSSS